MSFKSFKGISSQVRNDSSHEFEKAIRKFKRQTKESGLLDELRDRKYYASKGEKRRESKKAAIRRHKRNQLKEQQELNPRNKRR